MMSTFKLRAVFSAAIIAITLPATAQQDQPPSPNPPIGGLGNPGDLVSGGNMRAARRGIARDTLERQYTPAEITEMRQIVDQFDKSKSGVYVEAAKVIRRRVQVGMAPDSPVEEIRLNAENAGSIVFTDALGSPWKVVDVIAPTGYITAEKRDNVVIFFPGSARQGRQDQSEAGVQRFGRGSIQVMLEGLQSTVPFSLSYGLSKEVDGQVEAQIQAKNPASQASMVRADVIDVDESAEMFLDGEPPKNATPLRTSLKAVKAWIYNGRLYVRTNLALHSPAYKNYGSSAAGMSVYRFDGVPSIINGLVDGRIVSVGIGE